MAPPDGEMLRIAAVASLSQELKMAATQYDVEAFMEDASMQLEIHGPRLLAAALVLLEQRKRSEEWVSPLSGRRLFTPLLFVDPYLEHLKSRQAVAQAVSRAIGRPEDSVEGEGRSRRRHKTTQYA